MWKRGIEICREFVESSDTVFRLLACLSLLHDHVIGIGDNIPMVLCGNKMDLPDRKMRMKQITFHRKKVTFCGISFDL